MHLQTREGDLADKGGKNDWQLGFNLKSANVATTLDDNEST